MIRRVAFSFFVSFIGILSASTAMAAPYGFPDPLNNATVPILVNRIVTAILGIVGALFFVMFLWGGFKYMTAGGEAKKVQDAQKTLVNAVIGLILIGTSYAIASEVLKAIAAGSAG